MPILPEKFAVLGMASVSASGSKDGRNFPIAVGITRHGAPTVERLLINPPKEWNLFRTKEIKKTKNDSAAMELAPNFSCIGIDGKKLPTVGKSLEEVSEHLAERLANIPVYCVDVGRTRSLLSKIAGKLAEAFELRSMYRVVNESMGVYAAIETEVKLKSSYALFPGNDSDVRWIKELLYRCR